MAELIGQEQVGFRLRLLDQQQEAGQLWQDYEIDFIVNQQARTFSNSPVIASPQGEAIHLVPLSDKTVGRFRFNLEPHNELDALSKQILDFINNPKRQEMFFEPADPSFELHIQRCSHMQAVSQTLGNNTEEEFKVYLWIDAGNSTKLEYTWDAEGLRFMVKATSLIDFANGLLRSTWQHTVPQ